MLSEAFNRRSALAVLTAGIAAAATPAAANRPVKERNTDALLNYIRIRSRLDGKPAFYPYRGTIFGRPFGQSAVPLFDVEGFSWDQLTALPDRHFQIDTAEAGYFLDLKTGLPLDRWVNPLNGVETQVKHYRSFAHVIASDGKLEPVMGQVPVPGFHMTATMTPATVLNDKIWVHEDLIVRYPNKPVTSFADAREYVGPNLDAASFATWSANTRDLTNELQTFVPANLSYQTLGSWRPFMRMGNTPGLISWRMFGSKEPSVERIPIMLLQRVLKDYPDFLTRKI